MSRARRAGRLIGALAGTLVVVALLLFGVFPTRTYLGQRAATQRASQRLEALTKQNDALKARMERLDTDAEIERLAREQYNLVKPGEEAYAVLPAPLPPIELPSIWPYGQLGATANPDAAPDPATDAEG
jgi:cell division protein FtsB